MKKIIEESISKSDIIIWIITILFFVISAQFSGGDIQKSFMGAAGIIVLMFFVGFSIELILGALKHVKGLGEITGFITNGPEALVMIVGLITGDILFAASTPLGSNIMNPILLIFAIIITGSFILTKKFKYKAFYIFGFIFSAIMAGDLMYVLAKEGQGVLSDYYFLLKALGFTILCGFLYFLNRQITNAEHMSSENIENEEPVYYLPLGIVLLLIAGYFLDPVVNFTAEASKSPKGVIGFLVLATLTSWPEFKSCIALLRKNRILDAFVNILISNFTNIWLATIGIIAWVITK